MSIRNKLWRNMQYIYVMTHLNEKYNEHAHNWHMSLFTIIINRNHPKYRNVFTKDLFEQITNIANIMTSNLVFIDKGKIENMGTKNKKFLCKVFDYNGCLESITIEILKIITHISKYEYKCDIRTRSSNYKSYKVYTLDNIELFAIPCYCFHNCKPHITLGELGNSIYVPDIKNIVVRHHCCKAISTCPPKSSCGICTKCTNCT